MKLLLTTITSLLFVAADAQPNDFFLLKKNEKTVKSYYTGVFIDLITTYGYLYSGNISKVKNDSVWIEYREFQRMMTTYGGVIVDTFTYPALRFAVKDIAYIRKEEQGFAQASVPGLMMIGGGGYAVLHSINSLIQHEKINLRSMATAGLIFTTGFVMHIMRKDYYHIGKRHQLKYISLPGK